MDLSAARQLAVELPDRLVLLVMQQLSASHDPRLNEKQTMLLGRVSAREW